MSPRGEEFEVAGRARPVGLMGAPPIPAEARAELLVLKSGAVFLCARPDGDISGVSPSGEGLYAHDTRYLSELSVGFGAAAPVLLAHSVETGYRGVVNATNPAFTDPNGVEVPQDSLNLRRTFVLAERCYCSLLVHSYNRHRVTVPLALMLAADFADVFELRGVRTRHARGSAMVPKMDGARVSFGYVGQDGVFCETLVELDPPPSASVLVGERVHLRWDLELEADAQREILIVVSASAEDKLPKARSLAAANAALNRARDRWRGECTRIESDNGLFQSVLGASQRDIHALITPADGGRLPAAGIPWYVAPFGRDSLLTAYESCCSTRDSRATRCSCSPTSRRAPTSPGATPSRARSCTSCARRARARRPDPAHALLRHGRRDAAVPDARRRATTAGPPTSRR